MYRYLIVLLLTGCALSPVELREQGQRTEFKSAKTPREVANCMARNADEVRPLGGVVRDGSKQGSYDMLATLPSGGYALVAEISPHERGSQIIAWVSPYVLYKQDVTTKVFAGCE